LTTVGPRAPRTASLANPENYRSKYHILNDTGIDSVPINLSAKRATSKRELGRGRTCGTFVDVGAGCPIALVARVARACEGAGDVGARRVGVAVVGPICNRRARPVSFSVAPKRGRAIHHEGSTTLGLGGPRSGSIDYGRS
jgi:hypothetical protein